MLEALNDLFGLSGKIAIITGAAAGIGLGIARVLASAGATVVPADRDHTEAGRQAAAIAAAGRQAVAVAVDLADETSIVEACAHIHQIVGPPWLLGSRSADGAARVDTTYWLR